jgi:hypothetical protein
MCRILSLAIISAANLVAQQAQACVVVAPRDWGPAQMRQSAHDALTGATAIIDGEVIRPFIRGKQNALVLSYRVFKGARQNMIEVGEDNSCDVALERAGERSRMVLVGGPDVYYLRNDGSNARYEDRLLKSDRRRAWPFVEGAMVRP